MSKLLAEWIGQRVTITLRSSIVPVTYQAKLLDADQDGIMLELPKGNTFVPMTSIMHISREAE